MSNFLRFNYLITLVTGLLFTGCSTTQVIHFEQLQPSKLNIDQPIQSLAISENLSNTSAATPYNNKEIHSLKNIFIKELSASNMLQAIILVDQDRLATYPKDTPIPSNKASELLATMGTDALLNIYRVMQIKEGNRGQEPLIITNITANIYLKNNHQAPINPITLSDTIPEADYNYLHYAGYKEAYMEYLANRLTKEILPHWQPVNRILFLNGKLKKGYKLFNKGKIPEAIALWTDEYTREENKEIKIKAALNIALAYETTSQLEEAIHWANKAYSHAIQDIEQSPEQADSDRYKLSSLCYLYVSSLKERTSKINKLDKQLNNY